MTRGGHTLRPRGWSLRLIAGLATSLSVGCRARRTGLAMLVAAAGFLFLLTGSASATNTNYCDGYWGSTSDFCYSPNAYTYVKNWMSYNEGINYWYDGSMLAYLFTSDNAYVASSGLSGDTAYLCFGNQLYDIAAIRTPEEPSEIGGHDDNYPRSGCDGYTQT